MFQLAHASRSLLPLSSTQASPGRLDLGYGARASIRGVRDSSRGGGSGRGVFECNSSPELTLARTQQQESQDVRAAMSPLDDHDQIS